MRISKRTRKIAGLIEQQNPDITIALESATRNSARLRFDTLTLTFVYREGELLLDMPYRPSLTSDMYRLVFFKAAEAIQAVRTGHTEAAIERRKRSNNRPMIVQQGNLFP